MRPWRWMDFVPSWLTWPWRHEFITRSSDMASLKRFEADIFYTLFSFGRLVKDVFEQNFIVCSTSARTDVHDQLKWMVKVLKMMIKVLKLLFFSFPRITFTWCPRDPNRFARCLLRSLPVVKSRPRQNSAGRRWWLSQPKTSKVLEIRFEWILGYVGGFRRNLNNTTFVLNVFNDYMFQLVYFALAFENLVFCCRWFFRWTVASKYIGSP